MNKFFKSIAHKTFGLIAMAAAMTTMTSCKEFIYDYEGDCDPHYFVKFEYTMHMERGDAFKEQVKAVELWVFDTESGDYVDHYYSTVADLAETNYLLPINVKPGNYDFVAWCGDIDNRHFKVNGSIGSKHHASCRLEKRGYEGSQATSSEDLDLLFHGKLDGAVLPDEQGTHIYTVPLIRDVNNIMLTLQHVSGEFDTEHKRITLVDRNGSLLHDNNLDESDVDILYKPWSLRTGTVDGSSSTLKFSRDGSDDTIIDDSVATDGSYGNYMTTEFSTSRLITSHNPKITIADTETGQTIFQIPLMSWIQELKSNRYASMDYQEYLDRQHNYELMVILQDDGRGGWTAVSVVINGYHVIDNGSTDL